MMFSKPKGVRYVDMAIWIDDNVYKDNCDQEKLYEYIFHLSKMLAFKRALFNNGQQYEDFAVYAATKYFLRITDKRQFEIDENGEPKLPKIKSILNYIKKTIFPTKIDFDKEHSSSVDDGENDIIDTTFRDILESSIDDIGLSEFGNYLHDIGKTIRAHLAKIPYRQGTSEWENIYVSCLLSFLNSVTLGAEARQRIQEMVDNSKLKSHIIDRLYRKERQNSTILFHLDESMRGYITVLVNEIRKIIAGDLSEILHTHIHQSMYTDEMLKQSLNWESSDED